MLLEQTITKLNKMKMFGMAKEIARQTTIDEIAQLSFEERFSLLVDMEETSRENRRLKRLLAEAKLRENACIEDIDFRSSRGLDRSLVLSLASCSWIEKYLNVLLTGPTGAGKTFIACALGNAACRQGHSSFYIRAPRLFSELKIARADGSYVKLLNKLAKTKLLIIDDWGISPLSDSQRNDILEVIEDRYHVRSTIIISQIPIDKWHDVIGNPTIADAILDRITHNAYKINLKGESMRKTQQLLD
ncbi:MAG: AAA family ATPase [Candidatus Aquicultor secundus]|uniref:IS21-like element helper ATPase IstB n=1 Tax=Candidatus Aquicultor secundus TaxID=1973895 RepID=UPI000CC1F0A6|nr:IS21-like element helper ATPase IstB [Candidatus Aquicultor secundus]PIU26114.1 MAG: AAA family ATPase [Candidatus Aquicultor secundus]PIW21638.1 MAG: AAA family ATPase [Candidatus Aquicultor secundus]